MGVTISLEAYLQQVQAAGYRVPRLLADDAEAALRRLKDDGILGALQAYRDANWLEDLRRMRCLALKDCKQSIHCMALRQHTRHNGRACK
ncbi:unnamed protein product [Effrenium voratum]|uniref:Uncharacterized protein n=1 Tax=Effrenium voratum TaxID=2562239 RepID=A0AA36NK73_9DINO|nr:unnamed protein product [Effrenium voratum]